jgi:hypothetical protein
MIPINEKGQVFSTDILLAVIVFTMMLALSGGLITQVQRAGENMEQGLQRSQTTEQLLTHLLSTQGRPSNWEIESDRNAVESIGLVDERGVISTDKWSQFRDWNGDDYSSLRTWLGIPDQNFHLLITDLNQSTVSQAGITPSDVNAVASFTLPAVYAEELVYVQLQVHRK